MIKPTVGRVVWYWSDVKQQDQPFAAIVTRVTTDRLVGLAVFHPDGMLFFRNECILVQDGDVRPEREFCEWMPYQKGQAAKTEAVERRLMREGRPETPAPNRVAQHSAESWLIPPLSPATLNAMTSTPSCLGEGRPISELERVSKEGPSPDEPTL